MENKYLVVPRATCESWEYLPVRFTRKIHAGNYWSILPESQLYQFGVLNSSMHMAWIKCVSGKLQCYDRFHHNPTIKNFPWPITHTQTQIMAIEERALMVQSIRAQYPSTPLAELYNPLTMPVALRDAHIALDKAVDAAYGQTRFASEDSRVGFLLNLKHRLTSLMVHFNDDEPVLTEVPEVIGYAAGRTIRSSASIF